MSSYSRYTTFFLFESLFHRQSLPIPKPSPLRFTHYADVSENTLPFVSQSRNIFSDYDLSQTHDWERPSLSPHVLLIYSIPDNVRKIEKKKKQAERPAVYTWNSLRHTFRSETQCFNKSERFKCCEKLLPLALKLNRRLRASIDTETIIDSY